VIAHRLLVVVAIVSGLAGLRSLAQTADASIWTGVYTAAQAERGKAAYETHCIRCHGADLAGRRDYPLSGEGFMRHWEAHTLAHLFRRIRDSMPPDDVGGVSDEDKRDVVAYVLRQNGFPAGDRELPARDIDLDAVEITRKTGPGPLTTGALVGVTGCLEQRPDRVWQLTRAEEPQRTTLDASPGTGRATAGSNGPGTRTVRLLDMFPSPAAHLGHTIRVVGFFVKGAADDDAVNVVTMEMVAASCPSR
jgi:S-disulfanyl-L-cysteine oxidoreductase SoxD